MFLQSFLFISLDYVENYRFYLNWVILKKGWETLNFVKFFFQFLDWALSHLIYLCLCWPIMAFSHVFRQDSLMFMHCSHVSFIGAH